MATPIPINQCEFTIAEAVEATGGTLVRASTSSSIAGNARGVSIDTRSISPGAIFVALRGAGTDGHDYLAQAAARGAVAAIVSDAAVIILLSIASRSAILSMHSGGLRIIISSACVRRARCL